MLNISSTNPYRVWENQTINRSNEIPKSTNTKEEKGLSKTTKNVLITTGIALATLGVYIATRGKKAVNVAKNATNSAQSLNNKVNVSNTIPTNSTLSKVNSEISTNLSRIEFRTPVKYTTREGKEIILGYSNAEGTQFIPKIEGELFKEFKNTIITPKTKEEQQKILTGIRAELDQEFKTHAQKLGIKPVDNTYKMLRAANYSEASTLNGTNYNAIIETPVKGIKGSYRQYGAWYYREPIENPQNHSIFRVTLNCKVDKKLIEFLDDFILSNNIKAKYKMPSSLAAACKRTDTFNIYFQENIPDELLQKLAKEASKYARNESAVKSVGQKLANGVYKELEANSKDVVDLLRIAHLSDKKLGIDLGMLIKKELDNDIPGSIAYCNATSKASAGQIEAAKICLRKYFEKCN